MPCLAGRSSSRRRSSGTRRRLATSCPSATTSVRACQPVCRASDVCCVAPFLVDAYTYPRCCSHVDGLDGEGKDGGEARKWPSTLEAWANEDAAMSALGGLISYLASVCLHPVCGAAILWRQALFCLRPGSVVARHLLTPSCSSCASSSQLKLDKQLLSQGKFSAYDPLRQGQYMLLVCA